MALKIQRDQSRQGNINYILYLDAFEQSLGLKGDFRENIPGYNGYYGTKPGYDRVLGIGTVRGLNFLEAPKGTPAAGVRRRPAIRRSQFSDSCCLFSDQKKRRGIPPCAAFLSVREG